MVYLGDSDEAAVDTETTKEAWAVPGRDRNLEVKDVAGAGPMAVVQAQVPDSVDDLDPFENEPVYLVAA